MNIVNDYSGYGNEVLYRMCKEEPKHTDIDKIAGKIWLIGRSYSASIERQAGEKMIKGKHFTREIVAPQIRDSDIDKWLDSVLSITRVTEENVHLALSCHKNLTDLFKIITGKDKRSLASKYLHFHQPQAFFIYDSIANKAIRDRLLIKGKQRQPYPKSYDNTYASFVSRCMYYRDNYFETSIEGIATPRKLDIELLGY